MEDETKTIDVYEVSQTSMDCCMLAVGAWLNRPNDLGGVRILLMGCDDGKINSIAEAAPRWIDCGRVRLSFVTGSSAVPEPVPKISTWRIVYHLTDDGCTLEASPLPRGSLARVREPSAENKALDYTNWLERMRELNASELAAECSVSTGAESLVSAGLVWEDEASDRELKMGRVRSNVRDYVMQLANTQPRRGASGCSIVFGVHDATRRAVGARTKYRTADQIVEAVEAAVDDAKIIVGLDVRVDVHPVIVPPFKDGSVCLRFASEDDARRATAAFNGLAYQLVDARNHLHVDARVWRAISSETDVPDCVLWSKEDYHAVLAADGDVSAAIKNAEEVGCDPRSEHMPRFIIRVTFQSRHCGAHHSRTDTVGISSLVRRDDGQLKSCALTSSAIWLRVMPAKPVPGSAWNVPPILVTGRGVSAGSHLVESLGADPPERSVDLQTPNQRAPDLSLYLVKPTFVVVLALELTDNERIALAVAVPQHAKLVVLLRGLWLNHGCRLKHFRSLAGWLSCHCLVRIVADHVAEPPASWNAGQNVECRAVGQDKVVLPEALRKCAEVVYPVVDAHAAYIAGLASSWHASLPRPAACPWEVVSDTAYCPRLEPARNLSQRIADALPAEGDVVAVGLFVDTGGAGHTTAIRCAAYDALSSFFVCFLCDSPMTTFRPILDAAGQRPVLIASDVQLRPSALTQLRLDAKNAHSRVVLVSPESGGCEQTTTSPVLSLSDVRLLAAALSVRRPNDSEHVSASRKQALDSAVACAEHAKCAWLDRHIYVFILAAELLKYEPPRAYVEKLYEAMRADDAVLAAAKAWAFGVACARNTTAFCRRNYGGSVSCTVFVDTMHPKLGRDADPGALAAMQHLFSYATPAGVTAHPLIARLFVQCCW